MAFNVKGTEFQTFDLPTMTKQLQAYVLQMNRFRQVCAKKDAIGTGKGISHRWFIPGPDPDVFMYTKYPDRDQFLQEGSYSIYKNQGTVRELGFSMKYNIHDVDMSYLPIQTYVRDILGRDCKTVIDYLVKTELDLTPWKYIPTSDYRGATTSLDSYLTTGQSKTDKLAEKDEGKIILSERIYYGGWGEGADTSYPTKFAKQCATALTFSWGSNDAVCLTPNPLTFVTKVGTAAKWAVGPYVPSQGLAQDKSYAINMRAVDSSYPKDFQFSVSYKPTMNYIHLFNMIMYAQRIKMYGFGKLGGDYILICSPAQAAALYGSLLLQNYVDDTGAQGLRALIAPTSRDNVSTFLWGETAKIPLGLPVRVVIDNMGTLCEENWLEEGSFLDNTTPDGTTRQAYCPFDKLVPTYFGSRIDVKNFLNTEGTGAASEAVRVPVSTGAIPWITPVMDGETNPPHSGGRTRVTVTGLGQNAPTWIDTHQHVGPGDNAVSRRWPELGPCYLIGSSEPEIVQEILSMPEQVVQMSPLDFNRFGGLAWKMWANWRATHVSGKKGWMDKSDGSEVLWGGPNGAAIKNMITRMACIKFDYPVLITDSGATSA